MMSALFFRVSAKSFLKSYMVYVSSSVPTCSDAKLLLLLYIIRITIVHISNIHLELKFEGSIALASDLPLEVAKTYCQAVQGFFLYYY